VEEKGSKRSKLFMVGGAGGVTEAMLVPRVSSKRLSELLLRGVKKTDSVVVGGGVVRDVKKGGERGRAAVEGCTPGKKLRGEVETSFASGV